MSGNLTQISLISNSTNTNSSQSNHSTQSNTIPFSINAITKNIEYDNHPKAQRKHNKNMDVVKREDTQTNKIYLCEMCTKRFSKRSDLSNHMLMHQGSKPIQCDLCDKKFTNLLKYQQHINSKHANDQDIQHKHNNNVIQC